jgi:hypothetical protein
MLRLKKERKKELDRSFVRSFAVGRADRATSSANQPAEENEPQNQQAAS